MSTTLSGPLIDRMVIHAYLEAVDAEDRAGGEWPYVEGPGWRSTPEIADHFEMPLTSMRRRLSTMWERDYVERSDGSTILWRSHESDMKDYALQLVLNCFRQGVLEDLHSRGAPIGQEEMKALMIDAVDRTYTFLAQKLPLSPISRHWQTPKLLKFEPPKSVRTR